MIGETPTGGEVVDLDKVREEKARQRFIEEKGREPDVMDEIEKEPINVVEQLSSDLDIYTHFAANILILLKLAKEKGAKIDTSRVSEIVDTFKFDGENSQALFQIKQDLMALQHYLREVLGEEVYFDEALPQTEAREQALKRNSKFILTAGEEGEAL